MDSYYIFLLLIYIIAYTKLKTSNGLVLILI